MNTSSSLNSRHIKPVTVSRYFSAVQQQQVMAISTLKGKSTVRCLPAPDASSNTSNTISSSSSSPTDSSSSPTTSPIDGYRTPKSKNQIRNQTQNLIRNQKQKMPSKRKRLHLDDNVPSLITPTPTKRKASGDFLRKGQWTSTEERLTRLVIEAFEEGSLPIYTGIRLRGYLAVQLQCDPMRVSKKLCAGTIDGKQVPKNYGQKKFKLRKKAFWDSDEAKAQIAQLERLTRALWSEAQMRKPTFLTLSSTCNLNKRQGSPLLPARNHSPSSTPKTKKQKVFPIIYLNLYKLKRYSVGEESGSELASPSKDSDSESEPVKLDGESLQAAYDLLTLCSPRGTASKSRGQKGRSKKGVAKKGDVQEDSFRKADSSEGKRVRRTRARQTTARTS